MDITSETIINEGRNDIGKVSIMTVSGDGYSFDDIFSCGYDESTDMFVLKGYDDCVTYIPRESICMFTTVPKEQQEDSVNIVPLRNE